MKIELSLQDFMSTKFENITDSAKLEALTTALRDEVIVNTVNDNYKLVFIVENDYIYSFFRNKCSGADVHFNADRDENFSYTFVSNTLNNLTVKFGHKYVYYMIDFIEKPKEIDILTIDNMKEWEKYFALAIKVIASCTKYFEDKTHEDKRKSLGLRSDQVMFVK